MRKCRMLKKRPILEELVVLTERSKKNSINIGSKSNSFDVKLVFIIYGKCTDRTQFLLFRYFDMWIFNGGASL